MPPSDAILRNQLVEFLKGGHAHMDLDEAVEDFPMEHINSKVPNSTYTPWRLLEHIRITQWDILEYIRNPGYVWLKWPKDYWPPVGKKATPADWKKTIKDFNKDLKELIEIVKNPKTDLNAKTPQKDGQPIIREILLVIDHNAYHIGEFAILRDVMRTWPSKR